MLFLKTFDILWDKGRQLQLGLSQEGVIWVFSLLWSLVPLNPSLVCSVFVWVHVCAWRLPSAIWGLLWGFAFRGILLQTSYVCNICERWPGVCSLPRQKSSSGREAGVLDNSMGPLISSQVDALVASAHIALCSTSMKYLKESQGSDYRKEK